MTTRDQVKRAVGIDRGESARGSTSDYGPNLPERLLTARERKGVDLYRAERDTKIRARYLAALERGDYKELPGAVYTKGFLRNYALYLGLDPDDVLLQWRRERGEIKEPEPVIVVPRPIAAPRKGLTFSPAIIVAAIMTVAVAAFAIYLAMQIQRYVEPPTIGVTQPPTAVVDVDEAATSYVLRGTTIPGATVSIVSPSWDAADARDRRHGRLVDCRHRPPPRSQPVRHQRPRPDDAEDLGRHEAHLHHGPVPRDRDADAQPRPAGRGGDVRERSDPGPGHHHQCEGGRGPRDLYRAGQGRHCTEEPADPGAGQGCRRTRTGRSTPRYELTTGRWSLTVTASSDEGKTTSLTRNITVAYKGVNLVVRIKGGRAWIKVWVDGKVDKKVGPAGTVYKNGKTLTFQGKNSVEVRTGSSGVTLFTLNGTKIGALGKSGIPETWLFEPPDEPQKTNRH